MIETAVPAVHTEGPSNTKLVHDFLSTGTSKTVTGQEFMAFWKECSMDERSDYAHQVRQLAS